MARLDNNSPGKPVDKDKGLADFYTVPNGAFDVQGQDLSAGRLQEKLSLDSIAVFPFYADESDRPLPLKLAPVSDAWAMLPAAETAELPAPAVRKSRETFERVQELKEANNRLSRRCEQLESQSAEQQAQLQAYAKTVEAMCGALSEEVSGPLRWVMGFSRLLQTDHATGANKEGEDYVARIMASAGQLERQIQGLLKFGRMDLEPAACEPVALETCLCTVLGGLTETIGTRLAEVRVEGPLPVVRGDAALLRMVFTQLIDNASKFMAPGTTPGIRVWCQPVPGAARVYVEDNGVGIPSGECDRIFGLFQRLNADSSGTGAGLALVRKAVEKMGGLVGVESHLGRGSRFWVELPLLP